MAFAITLLVLAVPIAFATFALCVPIQPIGISLGICHEDMQQNHVLVVHSDTSHHHSQQPSITVQFL